MAIEKMKARSKKFAELVNACETLEDVCRVYPDSLKAIQDKLLEKVDKLDDKAKQNITKVSPIFREYLHKLEVLSKVVNAYEVTDILIDLNWTKNAYGYQARATYFDNEKWYQGSRTGGWGYDKASTASADVLNNPAVRKLVLDFLKKWGYSNARYLLGYGMYVSEYTGLPTFEGGVGIECHCNILQNLGFKVQHIGNSYRFTK